MENIKKNGLESLNFNSVESAGAAANHLVWKKHLALTITVIVISLPSIIISAVIPVTIFILYYSYFGSKAKKWFMQNFAAANGLSYQATMPLSEVKGKVFQTGRSRAISHVLTGNYNNHTMRLFFYRYTIGHGRYSVTFKITVLEIFFKDIDFPYILLQSQSHKQTSGFERMVHSFIKPGFNPKHALKNAPNTKKINLEDEFKDEFRLFAKEGYGIEALQIFSKDTLLFLREENADFSIEFIKDRLYIYEDLAVSNKNELKEMFEVTRKILDSMGPLLKRLSGHFTILHKYYRKK